MNQKLSINKIAGLTGHSGAVYALASNGDNTIYTGSGDKIVAAWDLQNPGEGKQIARSTDIIYTLCKLSQQNKLLMGTASGGIHVINLDSSKEERLLKYHDAPVFNIVVSEKNNIIFSLSGDGELGIIDLDSLELLKKMMLGNFKLRTAALNSDESLIAVGGGDGSVFIFSLPDMKPVKHWQAHQLNFSVNALRFSMNDNYLLSGSRDAHLNIFDVTKNFELHQSIPAHNYAIYSIVYSPDKLMFATASRDKTIKIWDANTFEMLHRINSENNDGHVNSVNNLLWHNESGYLISAGDDRAVLIWEINEGTE